MVNKLVNYKSSKKKYKIKRKFTLFLVKTKYISSRELKTLKFSFVLHTRENSDVFNTLDEIYLVFTSKKSISSMYFLFGLGMFICVVVIETNNTSVKKNIDG